MTRVRGTGLIAVICGAIVIVSIQVILARAADDNKACGLLTTSEIESILGTNVALKGGATPGSTHICTGQASNKRIMLRLVTGLDPGRDRSGSKERAGMEMIKQMGGQVEVKTFGPIVCSTLEPPAGKQQTGYNTTCTANKDTAMAGIEVTANTKDDMLPIDRLRPLVEKMMGRF